MEHRRSLEETRLPGDDGIREGFLDRIAVPFCDDPLDLGEECRAHPDIRAGVEEIGFHFPGFQNADTRGELGDADTNGRPI